MWVDFLDEVSLECVHVLWVRQVVKNQLGVLLMDALVIQEVLNLD
jgi:hypothetical protein